MANRSEWKPTGEGLEGPFAIRSAFVSQLGFWTSHPVVKPKQSQTYVFSGGGGGDDDDDDDDDAAAADAADAADAGGGDDDDEEDCTRLYKSS